MSTHLEQRLADWMLGSGFASLRLGLGVVFVGLGLPKLVPGLSPGEELIAATTPFLDAAVLTPTLGLAQVCIGVALTLRPLLPVALGLLALHLGATALPLVTLPDVTWRAILVPTQEGQLLLWNMLLVAAGLALAGAGLVVRAGRRGTLRRARPAFAPRTGSACPSPPARELMDTARIVTTRSRCRQGLAASDTTLLRFVRHGP